MIRIIALTEAGARLGQRLNAALPDSELLLKPKPFAETVQRLFTAGDRLIMVCATGIVMRTLAPVIDSKLLDPAVLVLDERGEFVIPLLSGHEGGANQWAAEIAERLSATAVITTAKPYLQPRYAVGMGCERGCSEAHLRDHLERCLMKAGLTIAQISSINSIDIKSDEVGLIALANSLQLPFQCFSQVQLASVESQLTQRSDYVFNTVGVYGVAESAALFGAEQLTGECAEMIFAKEKTNKATCAIARSFPL
jgi:cobalt-precorrin 5A hydrolase